jgi:serine/threonine protein kinase/Tol biopolymer transport system component
MGASLRRRFRAFEGVRQCAHFSMIVAPGTRLGPYEVLAPLGAGGMGEVWRARDTRLDRSVAIKILPDGFAQNEQFRARFEREAKTISSLNHANICTLFDVGHENGSHYLVMELLEGESLADRLARGPLPVEQVLRFGAQIADALDAAHKQGVVHRDLKPGNVMITKSGAKLLDFGLARPSAATSAVHGLTEMPTTAKPLTEEGTILGTFQYMAPEQLEGLEADARTDIFTFGALLYEMATGRRAFAATSRTSLIAAIVSSQPPPISTITPMTPPAVDHVVRKCLEKHPDDRWQSAHDVASELRWIADGASQAGVPTAVSISRRMRERLAWVLAALATIGALTAVTLLRTRHDRARTAIESAIVTPAGWRIVTNSGLSLSPDGETAVFVLNEVKGGHPSMWLRPLASSTFRQLPGTDGAVQPFWSPDSRKIGFFAGGKLKTVDTESGTVSAVCDVPGGGGGVGSWSSLGTILVAPDLSGPLAFVRASGGTLQPLTKLRAGDTAHRFPAFLSDGKTFLFLAVSGTNDKNAICQTSVDDPATIREVMRSSSAVEWVEPGIILYAAERHLLAQRYDASKARVVGEPITVSDRFTLFSASNDGKLLLQRNPNLVISQLAWVSRTGREERVVEAPGLFFSPALSHDQRRFAVDISDAADGNGDIWIYDVTRNAATRLTYSKENESSPHWSEDDRSIIYYSGPNGSGDIFEVSAGGIGKPELLVSDAREKRPTDVSRDGQWIVFNSAEGENMDIGVWASKEKKARPWLATPFREQCARLSADGKWIAYQSDESGRWEIYVRAFPDSDRKWLLSNAGGIMPMWRGDGRELFYVSLEGKMMSVAVTPGPEFVTEPPATLFDAPLRNHPTTQYDVTSDGQHFLLNKRVESVSAEPVALVQNWDVKLAGK